MLRFLAPVLITLGLIFPSTIAGASESSVHEPTTVSPDSSLSLSWSEIGSLSRSATPQANYSTSTNQTPTGGLRTEITITSANAPTAFRYELHLPPNSHVEKMSDGTVSLNVDGKPVGSFRKPWAKDANGQLVPTDFEIDGNTLVQRVSHSSNSSYPVVADPHFEWQVISGKIYLNKQETQVTGGLAGATSIAAIPWLAAIPSIPTKIASTVLGSIATIAAWAITARNQGVCLGITVGDFSGFPPSPVSNFHHTGEHCN